MIPLAKPVEPLTREQRHRFFAQGGEGCPIHGAEIPMDFTSSSMVDIDENGHPMFIESWACEKCPDDTLYMRTFRLDSVERVA